jgi:hypothetical protein
MIDDHLDCRIKELVVVLNKFKGIETFSSCGGHVDPLIGQVSRGRYYVDFWVAPNKVGFQSLERINQCICNYFLYSEARINVGDVGGCEDDDLPCMCFEIRGRFNPKIVADMLETCLIKWTRSSNVERFPEEEGVAGSSPVESTTLME